ncbi:MAG: hypothetical protein JWM36_3892 [Hyphomicrobiales bacterium]|nr:hypothetical protein [Hyphomicrobiales bacterium]
MTKFRMTIVGERKPERKPAKFLELSGITAQMFATALLSFTAVSIVLSWGGIKVF